MARSVGRADGHVDPDCLLHTRVIAIKYGITRSPEPNFLTELYEGHCLFDGVLVLCRHRGRHGQYGQRHQSAWAVEDVSFPVSTPSWLLTKLRRRRAPGWILDPMIQPPFARMDR